MNKETTNTSTQAVINQAIDITDVQQSSIADLGALFSAIRKISDEHSEAYKLAGMGMYLADDWAEMAENSKSDLVSMG
tara:strand:+ start:15518 stop:15751 length:234 start_codon:yes stop_codon:yes gene_type:complete